MSFPAALYVDHISPFYFEGIPIATPSFFSENSTIVDRRITTSELIIFTDGLSESIFKAKNELSEGVFLTHSQVFD